MLHTNGLTNTKNRLIVFLWFPYDFPMVRQLGCTISLLRGAWEFQKSNLHLHVHFILYVLHEFVSSISHFYCCSCPCSCFFFFSMSTRLKLQISTSQKFGTRTFNNVRFGDFQNYQKEYVYKMFPYVLVFSMDYCSK